MNRAYIDTAVVADMTRWMERAVIGLNLCPFAKAVHVKGQIHYVVSHAESEGDLLVELEREARALVDMEASTRDTTMLMTPFLLQDFLDYNDFLERADKLLRRMNLEGVLQIASFHPRYQFADAEPEDISNFTNRAPYPVLHLLREDSIDKAIDAFPEAEEIFERNMETMNALGVDGWNELHLGASVSNTRNLK